MTRKEFEDLMQFTVVPEVVASVSEYQLHAKYGNVNDRTITANGKRAFDFLSVGKSIISAAADHGVVVDVYRVHIPNDGKYREDHFLIAMNGTNAVYLDIGNDAGDITNDIKLYELEIPMNKIPSRFHNRKHDDAAITDCWTMEKINGPFHLSFTKLKLKRAFTKRNQ